MNKKNLIIGGVAMLILVSLGIVFFDSKKKEAQNDKNVFRETIDASGEYLSLRLRTDEILTKASTYPDYDTWNKEMSRVIKGWEKMEKTAKELEEMADDYLGEEVGFNLISTAHAYDKQEISNVFDNAPAGKKIKTLAKFLGVDAKRAFKILQMDQDQLKADAWNEAGDEFQKLETSAVVIKDGCKVAGFVGGVVITGGTAGFAAAGTLSQTAVVVAGADLVLEVSEDAANISFGNNNEVSEVVGNIRKITEPAAAILAIADLPENVVKNIDKLNVFIFGADQFRSTVQDGKVIGIKLPEYEKEEEQPDEVGIVVIAPEDIEEWLEEEGYERYDGDVEDILSAYDDEDDDYDMYDDEEENDEEYDEEDSADDSMTDDEETGNEGEKESMTEENVDANNDSVVGVWSGLVTDMTDDGESYTRDLVITLNGDGTCKVEGEYEFFTWKQQGNVVKMFVEGGSDNDYFEWNLAGDMLTFVKMAGLNSDDEIVEVYAGEDFFGSPFPMITLIKQ